MVAGRILQDELTSNTVLGVVFMILGVAMMGYQLISFLRHSVRQWQSSRQLGSHACAGTPALSQATCSIGDVEMGASAAAAADLPCMPSARCDAPPNLERCKQVCATEGGDRGRMLSRTGCVLTSCASVFAFAQLNDERPRTGGKKEAVGGRCKRAGGSKASEDSDSLLRGAHRASETAAECESLYGHGGELGGGGAVGSAGAAGGAHDLPGVCVGPSSSSLASSSFAALGADHEGFSKALGTGAHRSWQLEHPRLVERAISRSRETEATANASTATANASAAANATSSKAAAEPIPLVPPPRTAPEPQEREQAAPTQRAKRPTQPSKQANSAAAPREARSKRPIPRGSLDLD